MNFDTDLECTIETIQHPWSDHRGVLLTVRRGIDTNGLDETPEKLTEAVLQHERVVEKAREAFNKHLTYEVVQEGDGRKWRYYGEPGDFIFHYEDVKRAALRAGVEEWGGIRRACGRALKKKQRAFEKATRVLENSEAEGLERRDGRENILAAQIIYDRLEENDEDAAIISLDAEKAFDRVSHEVLKRIFQAL